MKKNKIEKRLFKAADNATPKTASFEEATKDVSWNQVDFAQKPQRRKYLIPALSALSVCLALGVVAAILVSNSAFAPAEPESQSGSGDATKRPITFGDFSIREWECNDSSINLSATSIKVSDGTSFVSSDNLPLGSAPLYQKGGPLLCVITFVNGPLSLLDYGRFGDFLPPQFSGNAFSEKESYRFWITFSPKSEPGSSVQVRFENISSTISGRATYRLEK